MYPSYPHSRCYDEGGELSRTSSYAVAFLQHSQLRAAVSPCINHLCWDIGETHRCVDRVVLRLVPLSIQPFCCLAAGWRAASAPRCWKCRVQSFMFLYFFGGVVGFLTRKVIPLTLLNLLPVLTLNASIQGPWRAVWRLRCLYLWGQQDVVSTLQSAPHVCLPRATTVGSNVQIFLISVGSPDLP